MQKKTALYQKHVDMGARMVDFAGYLMPVQYTGVIAEHMAVRQKAGLFDVSHMGEVYLRGAGALQTLQMLLSNNMQGFAVGACRYSPMCNPTGGVVDDLIVYRTGEEEYLLVVNAGNHDKDVEWIKGHLAADTEMEDASDAMAELALQGPAAAGILEELWQAQTNIPEQYYTFADNAVVAGVGCLVSRTGYTGEDGFELYCAVQDSPRLWDALLAAGEKHGLAPCGLGARDTLRLEAGMPLYGHEMDEETTPIEANLGMFVKMDKPDFIGKEALAAKGTPQRRRTGLRITGRGIAREGAPVYWRDALVGQVTSGTQLPYMGYAGAMAMMDVAAREIGEKVMVDVRGRMIEAEVVRLPFYKREK